MLHEIDLHVQRGASLIERCRLSPFGNVVAAVDIQTLCVAEISQK
jgi:hypothetical protein